MVMKLKILFPWLLGNLWKKLESTVEPTTAQTQKSEEEDAPRYAQQHETFGKHCDVMVFFILSALLLINSVILQDT